MHGLTEQVPTNYRLWYLNARIVRLHGRRLRRSDYRVHTRFWIVHLRVFDYRREKEKQLTYFRHKLCSCTIYKDVSGGTDEPWKNHRGRVQSTVLHATGRFLETVTVHVYRFPRPKGVYVRAAGYVSAGVHAIAQTR